MKKQPRLMSLSLMRDIFEPHRAQIREHLFINNELAVIFGDPLIFRLVMQQVPPFTIDDHRMGIITQGEIRVNVNLVEKRFTAGMMVFLGPGSIITPLSFSDDLQIFGVGLSKNFPLPFAPGQLPPAFNGQVRDFQLQASEADLLTARNIIETLWQLVHQPDYNRQTAASLVAAQMHLYDGLYRQHADRQQATLSREQTIFDRFIDLVNQHSQQHHHLDYYAQRMCLTERYLGTVIRQASGVTAKEWIDRALVARIQVALRHTDKTVAQIADELSFPNPSFFCKYFKRLTGLTPQEFRRQ